MPQQSTAVETEMTYGAMASKNQLMSQHLRPLMDVLVDHYTQAPAPQKPQNQEQVSSELTTLIEHISATDLGDENNTFFHQLKDKIIAHSQSLDLSARDSYMRLDCIPALLDELTPADAASTLSRQTQTPYDVFMQVASLMLDVRVYGRGDLAAMMLNRYLKRSDDYAALDVLALYQALAALRAIAQMPASQTPAEEKGRQNMIGRYLGLIPILLSPAKPVRCIAVGGLSGSGKSTLGKALTGDVYAVHVRADAVRKHIAGVPVMEQAPMRAYTEEMTAATYVGMLERAKVAAAAGMNVIIDGVHAKEEQREAVEMFARKNDLAFTGLWCSVPFEVAKRRIASRGHVSSQADTEKQLLLDTGRVTWHRIDTLYATDQVVDRVMALMALGSAEEQAI